MAEVESTATGNEQPQGALGRLTQLAWQALPAIAGAISLLGFVALVGGAIEWVRFWSAGLPADQAVRAVPKPELVTIGAVSLVGYSILGLLVVLGLYLIDKRGNATLGTLRGLFALAVLESFVTLCLVDLPIWESVLYATGFAVTGYLTYRVLRHLPELLAKTRSSEELATAAKLYRAASERHDDAVFQAQLPPGRGGGLTLRDATVELRRAEFDWIEAVERWRRAAPEERTAAAARLALRTPPTESEFDADVHPPTEQRRIDSPKALWEWVKRAARKVGAVRPGSAVRAIWQGNLPRGVSLALALAALIAAALPAIIGHNEEERLLGGVVAVVVGATAATFLVAHLTSKFAWYGIAVFAALILYGAALNIGLVIRDPLVQPAALVRKGDLNALCGVYVTETDSRIYMGRVQKEVEGGGVGADGGAGRVFWVPKEEVDVVSVGPLMEIDRAQFRALELTGEVQLDRADKPPAKTNPPKRATPRVAEGLENEGCRTADLTEFAYEQDLEQRRNASP